MSALNQVIQALRFLERQGALPAVRNMTALAQQIIQAAKDQAKQEKQR